MTKVPPKQIYDDLTPETSSSLPHVLVDARYASHQKGGDRCRYELASNLIKQKTANYSFLAYPHAHDTLPASDFPIIETTCKPSSHPQADIFEHITIPRIAKRIKADIYHGTFQTLPLFRPAKVTILTVHDLAVFAFPGGYGRRFVQYMRKLLSASIKNADTIVTVSEATRSELIRLFPYAESKSLTILNGVGTEFGAALRLPENTVQTMRNRLSLAAPYILFVGNLEPKKNLPRLIQAYKRLRASGDITHELVIVGKPLAEGPESGITRDDLASGHIKFTGYLEDQDLPLAYRAADLVAYPSLYEGFGMPVLEGMAAGVPVLTSSVSSLPEVAGGAAMLVDPYNIDSIAGGLSRALSDIHWRKEAIQKGLLRAAEMTWSENARKTGILYQDKHAEMLGHV